MTTPEEFITGITTPISLEERLNLFRRDLDADIATIQIRGEQISREALDLLDPHILRQIASHIDNTFRKVRSALDKQKIEKDTSPMADINITKDI
jgi:hypothetical protein